MRQNTVQFLTVLNGQEYENACQELARKLSSDLPKRGTEVTVKDVSYKLSNKNIRDIKKHQTSQGKPVKQGLNRPALLKASVAFVAIISVSVWLALGTNPKAWAPTAILLGGSLLSMAAAREFYQALSKRDRTEASWKLVVAVGAILAFMGLWAPSFAESWDEVRKSWEAVRGLF